MNNYDAWLYRETDRHMSEGDGEALTEECPECEGFRDVRDDGGEKIVCPTCNGEGWIEVESDLEPDGGPDEPDIDEGRYP